MNNSTSSELRSFYWLLAGIVVLFGFSMWNHPFIPSMEPRFGEAIREMAETGEYLIPIKNGLAYIMYPPLYYWMALGGKLAGLPDTVAIRLPAAIAFIVWLVWLVRLQKLLFPTWPSVMLPLIGAALPGVLFNFFIAQTDGLLILGTLIAFTGFARFRLNQIQFGFPWELWLGVTLAVAAKGPVGMIITLPAMVLEILLECWHSSRDLKTGRIRSAFGAAFNSALTMGWARGLGLVVLINAPWYIAAGFKEGWEFCRAILIYQNVTRFLEGFAHLQPWWYYGKTIWYDFFPISLLFPFGLYCVWRKPDDFSRRLPAVWALYTIFFFSLSQSKQGKYLLPAAPAITMVGLLALDYLWSERTRQRIKTWLQRWATGFLIVFGIIAIIALPFYGDRIGGLADLKTIRNTVNKTPGRIYTYQWPRSMMIYELGYPLPYARSSRDLYSKLHNGDIRPGDYLLVARKFLPQPGHTPDENTLYPAPAAPYFELVLSLKMEGHLNLYRVLPGANEAPIPDTPTPSPVQWWEQFDTD